MPPKNASKGGERVSILAAVSDWMKLLALIVLSGEALLTVAYSATKSDDPMRSYLFPIMIALLGLIVLGLFFDRWLQRSAPMPASGTGPSERLTLATNWPFRSGVTEESLDLDLRGNSVTGTRKTRYTPSKTHPQGEDTYVVTGARVGGTFWLSYHLPNGGDGGGVILLDKVTNDRYSGIVVSKDCNSGVKQCRANVWLSLRVNHQKTYFQFVGASVPSPNGDFVIEHSEDFKKKAASPASSASAQMQESSPSS